MEKAIAVCRVGVLVTVEQRVLFLAEINLVIILTPWKV
jgi:hypothetical protein